MALVGTADVQVQITGGRDVEASADVEVAGKKERGRTQPK